MDVFINFISAQEDPVTLLPIVSLKIIALNYISSWFILDLISCIPINEIEALLFRDTDPNN
jgi:hypothetical protein